MSKPDVSMMLKSKVRIGERKKFVKTTEGPTVSHALEDYLKSIYQLAEESEPVIAARIAAETGVSPSTIFTTLQRLAREGYVTINRRKEIHLRRMAGRSPKKSCGGTFSPSDSLPICWGSIG